MIGNSIVVMLGTALNTQGGVSSVVEVLRAGGLFDRSSIRYIESHCDGTIASKIAKAIRAWAQFIKVLGSESVALVHIHLASDGSFWRKLVFFMTTKVMRIPVLLHLHGAEFHIFFGESRFFLTKIFVRYMFESADGVIVLSKSWERWVRSNFKQSRVFVLYNPISLPSLPEVTSRDSDTLLFLGRVGARKGIFDLIDALAMLLKYYPNVMLLVGGDGEVDAARQYAILRGVESKVTFLGWVRGEVKSQLLQKATVYVLPSYNEGLPMSVLEAMAFGLPVVSTYVGGIPEAISNEVEGLLIDAGDISALFDRLRLLLGDVDLRQRFGAAARKRAEKTFSVDRIVPQLEEIYDEILRVR